MGQGDKVTENVDVKEIESGQSVDDFKKLIVELKSQGEEGLSKYIASLMKGINESVFTQDEGENDLLQRKLINEIRAEVQRINEPTRTGLNELIADYQKSNENIPEDASVEEIAEFVNNPDVEKVIRELIAIELPENLDKPGIRMTMWKEMLPVVRAMSKTEIQNIDTTLDAFDVTKVTDSDLKITKDLFAKGFGNETADTFEKSYKNIMLYSKNLVTLSADTTLTDIKLDQINVSEHISSFNQEITHENKPKLVEDLRKLSGEDFDQDKAIEDIVADTNKIDGEKIEGFLGSRDKNGENIAESIIKMENNSALGSTMTDFISNALKKGGPLAILIKLFFGPKFAEAFAEGNVKKRKALLNLIKLSEEGSNELSAQDFSKISGNNLEGFFKSMDSHGIDYSDKNFWEGLTTGKVDGNDTSENILKMHTLLKEGRDDFGLFDDQDFTNDNQGFLIRLNSLPVKETAAVIDAQGKPIKPKVGATAKVNVPNSSVVDKAA